MLCRLFPPLPLGGVQHLVLRTLPPVRYDNSDWTFSDSFGQAQDLRFLCVEGLACDRLIHELTPSEHRPGILFPALEELRLSNFADFQSDRWLTRIVECLKQRHPEARLRSLVFDDPCIIRCYVAEVLDFVDELVCISRNEEGKILCRRRWHVAHWSDMSGSDDSL
ncbi:uncharacterized protein PHACADRAFT_257434 [Phanerochaete carnosa HHB-10118-sp]|uniref:Uncharacterized protein n=1 Tax=Phanerochaete carnosa (strain HHB-10118-sp) TaxID=650164 RepID=K5WU20_PHACS|nr:uncharacterized protein PHACADRAFT_257434 [Phanerochaete carnosa HHB-10118-sp]EKM53927.1 hypothetical protein PHACADRAFT_257434 [Phanerochaete carnosa HHB-10118-sp]